MGQKITPQNASQHSPTWEGEKPALFLTKLRSLVRRWHVPEDVILVMISLIIGLVTGLIMAGFASLVDQVASQSQKHIIHQKETNHESSLHRRDWHH